MSWLQFANTSNKLTRTYLKDFLDVSGNVIIRTGDLTVVDGNANVGRNVVVSGNAHVKGDLKVDGKINFAGEMIQTDIHRIVYVSEQVDVSNSGTGPALIARQYGTEPIAYFYDDTKLVVSIADGGDVSMNRDLYVGRAIYAKGALSITNTASSTSTNTGALQVLGGVGIAGNLYVGGSVNVSGSLITSGLNSTANSTVSGSLVVTGGLNSITDTTVGGNLRVTGSQTVAGFNSTSDSTVTGSLSVASTLASTSTNTGALQVAGGVGIGGNLYVGGIVSLSGKLTTTENVTNLGFGYQSLSSQSGTATGNTAFGYNSGKAITTGTSNIAIGQSAIGVGSTTTGTDNVCVGNSSGGKLTGGIGNIGVGLSSLAEVTTGNNNVAIGQNVGTKLSIGYQNIGIGTNCLGHNSAVNPANQPYNNIGIGFESLFNLTVAVDNMGIGSKTLRGITTGNYNTAVGSNALIALVGGSNNVMVGINAGSTMVGGESSVGIGANCMGQASSTAQTGLYNTCVGYGTLNKVQSGASNVMVGINAGLNLTSGNGNVGIGNGTMGGIVTGGENIGIGSNTLNALTGGTYNIGIGSNTLYRVIGGTDNIGIGQNSLAYNTTNNGNVGIGTNTLINTTGTSNVAIGIYAGQLNTTGTYNTFVGASTDSNGNSYSQSTAIGYNAQITASNQIVLGTTSATVICPSTSASTSTATGALVVAGGVGIKGNVYVSGILNINNGNLLAGGPNTIALWPPTSGYGFGIASGTVKYLTVTNHTFYCGSTSTANGTQVVNFNTVGATVTGKLSVSGVGTVGLSVDGGISGITGDVDIRDGPVASTLNVYNTNGLYTSGSIQVGNLGSSQGINLGGNGLGSFTYMTAINTPTVSTNWATMPNNQFDQSVALFRCPLKMIPLTYCFTVANGTFLTGTGVSINIRVWNASNSTVVAGPVNSGAITSGSTICVTGAYPSPVILNSNVLMQIQFQFVYTVAPTSWTKNILVWSTFQQLA